MHNRNDIRDIIARAQYTLACCQTSGNLILDGHRKSAGELDNEVRCRNLCTSIEKLLGTATGRRFPAHGETGCTEEEIPDLLETYDMLHRIGYGLQPDQRFMQRQRHRVYRAWQEGNRLIPESGILALLAKDVQGHLSSTFSTGSIQGKQTLPEAAALVGLYNTILDSWMTTLKSYGCFPGVTTFENYRRLSLLMRLNLDVYFDSGKTGITLSDTYDDAGEAKWHWYKRNRIDETDFSSLSSAILKSYRSFNSSLFPSVLDYEEQQETDSLLLEELSSRSDLHPYERKSYQLLLINRKELINF